MLYVTHYFRVLKPVDSSNIYAIFVTVKKL
jgi:hypothetical protein